MRREADPGYLLLVTRYLYSLTNNQQPTTNNQQQ